MAAQGHGQSFVAQNRTFECCTGARVCSRDAAHLGKPAEETEVFEVTSHVTNFTTILPNQARTCNTLPLQCNTLQLQCNNMSLHANSECLKGFFERVCYAIMATTACCIFLWSGCVQRRRLCSVMQAPPEWRGQNTQQDGSLLKQGSQKWKQNLYKFLVSKGVKMQKTHFKDKGFANKHRCKAYDQNKCVAPKAHETMFTVPMSSLLGALQRQAADRQMRCCTKDSSTGATRFESLYAYCEVSRILAPSVWHRSSSLIARSDAVTSRIHCTSYTTTITTPQQRRGLHR